jgi:proteasome lid subunit RPN8/RPN11
MQKKTLQQYILPYLEWHKLQKRAYQAQKRDQSEICGVLICGEDNRIELMYINNTSKESGHYEYNVNLVVNIENEIAKKGKYVLGTFHSHPISEAIPSKGDMMNGFYNNIEMIYDVCGREARLWKLINKSEMVIEELHLINEQRGKSAP